MKKRDGTSDDWAIEWLDSVASGRSTMSQRSVKAIEKRAGGEKRLRKLAKERGVHLIRLTDDRGTPLVAASKHPFKVIC